MQYSLTQLLIDSIESDQIEGISITTDRSLVHQGHMIVVDLLCKKSPRNPHTHYSCGEHVKSDENIEAQVENMVADIRHELLSRGVLQCEQ